MHFSCFCVSGNGGIGLCINQIADPVFYRTLTNTADFNHAGHNNFRLFLMKIWIYLILKHRNQFIRWSRKKNHYFPIFFHNQSGCCTICIVKNDGTFRYESLFPVIVSYFCIRTVGIQIIKICLNAIAGMFIFYKIYMHDFGCDFFCQIILRGSQTTAENDHIRTIHGLLDYFCHSFFVITYNCLVIHTQSKSGTHLRQICRIGIDDISQQQFCAYANKFNNHCFILFFLL